MLDNKFTHNKIIRSVSVSLNSGGKGVKVLNCQQDIMGTLGIFMFKHGHTYRDSGLLGIQNKMGRSAKNKRQDIKAALLGSFEAIGTKANKTNIKEKL